MPRLWRYHEEDKRLLEMHLVRNGDIQVRFRDNLMMQDKIIIELFPYNINLTIRLDDTDIIVLYKDGSYVITNFADEIAEGRLEQIMYYGYLYVSDRIINKMKQLKDVKCALCNEYMVSCKCWGNVE